MFIICKPSVSWSSSCHKVLRCWENCKKELLKILMSSQSSNYKLHLTSFQGMLNWNQGTENRKLVFPKSSDYTRNPKHCRGWREGAKKWEALKVGEVYRDPKQTREPNRKEIWKKLTSEKKTVRMCRWLIRFNALGQFLRGGEDVFQTSFKVRFVNCWRENHCESGNKGMTFK